MWEKKNSIFCILKSHEAVRSRLCVPRQPGPRGGRTLPSVFREESPAWCHCSVCVRTRAGGCVGDIDGEVGQVHEVRKILKAEFRLFLWALGAH